MGVHTRLAPRRLADGGDRAAAARRRLLADHHGTLAGVIAAADAVVADRDGPATASAAVTDPLSTALDDRDLLEPLLSALADAADAAGGDLPHEPAAAPPYLTVTSRGPVLRATLDAGRLVVVVGVFAVERDSDGHDDSVAPATPVSYRRGGDRPETVLTVEFHGDGGTTVAGPGDGTDATAGPGGDADPREGEA